MIATMPLTADPRSRFREPRFAAPARPVEQDDEKPDEGKEGEADALDLKKRSTDLRDIDDRIAEAIKPTKP